MPSLHAARALQWDAVQLLDYAAQVGLDNIQFSELPHIACTISFSSPYGISRAEIRSSEPCDAHLEATAHRIWALARCRQFQVSK